MYLSTQWQTDSIEQYTVVRATFLFELVSFKGLGQDSTSFCDEQFVSQNKAKQNTPPQKTPPIKNSCESWV